MCLSSIWSDIFVTQIHESDRKYSFFCNASKQLKIIDYYKLCLIEKSILLKVYHTCQVDDLVLRRKMTSIYDVGKLENKSSLQKINETANGALLHLLTEGPITEKQILSHFSKRD